MQSFVDIGTRLILDLCVLLADETEIAFAVVEVLSKMIRFRLQAVNASLRDLGVPVDLGDIAQRCQHSLPHGLQLF